MGGSRTGYMWCKQLAAMLLILRGCLPTLAEAKERRAPRTECPCLILKPLTSSGGSHHPSPLGRCHGGLRTVGYSGKCPSWRAGRLRPGPVRQQHSCNVSGVTWPQETERAFRTAARMEGMTDGCAGGAAPRRLHSDLRATLGKHQNTFRSWCPEQAGDVKPPYLRSSRGN